MIFGSYAYGSSEYAGKVTQVMECHQPPSCNLIIMNLLEQCSGQYPGHLDLDEISMYIDNSKST